MARIPDSGDVSGQSFAGLRAPSVRVPTIPSTGAALAASAAKLAEVGHDVMVARRTAMVDSATAKAQHEIKGFVLDMSERPTPEGAEDDVEGPLNAFQNFAPRYKDKIEEIMERHKDAMDERTFSVFDRRMESFIGNQALTVRRLATKGIHDANLANLDLTLRTQADLASRAANSLDSQIARAAGTNAIVRLRETGNLTTQQAGDKIRQFQAGIDTNRANALILSNPAQAVKVLQGDELGNLAEKDRLKLHKAAIVARDTKMVDDVLDFAERQPGMATAFAKIKLGEFDDPALSAAYKALPAGKRLKLQSTVLNTYSERRALLKGRADDDEAATKLLTDDLKRELYLEKSAARRVQLFGQIQRAGTETPESEAALLQVVLGDAGFSPFPNPSLEAEFMRDLQESTNVGPDDIRAAQLQFTQAEFTRVMARARALQSTALRDSFALIDREFGLPPGNVFPTQDQVELSAELEPLKADLQRFLEENPDASVGEIREQRDAIVKEARGKVKEAVDTRTLERIERTAEAIPGFDITKPEESLKALIAVGKLEADSTQARQMSSAIRSAKKRGLLK